MSLIMGLIELERLELFALELEKLLHSSLTDIHCFDNDFVVKQPVAWKEYCAEYWLKKLLESISRCTACWDITVITLKKACNTIQSINKSKANPNF